MWEVLKIAPCICILYLFAVLYINLYHWRQTVNFGVGREIWESNWSSFWALTFEVFWLVVCMQEILSFWWVVTDCLRGIVRLIRSVFLSRVLSFCFFSQTCGFLKLFNICSLPGHSVELYLLSTQNEGDEFADAPPSFSVEEALVKAVKLPELFCHLAQPKSIPNCSGAENVSSRKLDFAAFYVGVGSIFNRFYSWWRLLLFCFSKHSSCADLPWFGGSTWVLEIRR